MTKRTKKAPITTWDKEVFAAAVAIGFDASGTPREVLERLYFDNVKPEAAARILKAAG